MTTADFSDETLMRFADGELDDAASARIEEALATDDALAMRLAAFVETRAAAQDALKPLLDEPVPAALTTAVERMIAAKKAADAPAGNIVQFAPRRPSLWQLPLAASLAAVIGGATGYWIAMQPASLAGVSVAGISGPSLTGALATVASGSETTLTDSGDRFRAIASFRDSGQSFCREFEVDSPRQTVVAVACRDTRDWRISFAVAAPGGSDGYAPASSTDALEAYLSAIEAGPALTADEEAQALAILSAPGAE